MHPLTSVPRFFISLVLCVLVEAHLQTLSDDRLTGQKELDHQGSVVDIDIAHDVDTARPTSRDNFQRLIRMEMQRPRRPLRRPAPLTTPLFKSEDRNISLLAHRRSHEVDLTDTPAMPTALAVLSALGASIGYLVMMIMRCKGLLRELAPKQPLKEFMPSYREPTRVRGEPHRKRGKGVRLCSSRVRTVPLPVPMATGAQGVVPQPPCPKPESA